MLFDDYEAYLEKYRSDYGKDTIVLMQCGSFYELYDDGTKKTDLKAIGELLNIQVSRRNKAIVEVSRNNLEMAGFPSYTLKKFIHMLVQSNYTCVVVSQTTSPPNPKREVTDIISPGTYVEDEVCASSSYLMSIYAEEHEEFRSGKISIAIGASLVDLGTGKTYVFETTSRNNDLVYPMDELYRLIVSYNPKEVLLCGNYKDHQTSVITFEKLVSYLDLDNKCVHNEYAKSKGTLTKISYQEEILRKVYPNTGMMSCVELLGLERKPCAQTSFVRLLQFVNDHNERVLEKLHVPQILEETDSLILSYNSIKQLDIVSKNENSAKSTSQSKTNSLFDILNNCKTAVGRRYFKERLFSPLSSVKKLNNSYQIIGNIMGLQLQSDLKRHLQEVHDLERLFRKIDMGTIQPFEVGYVVSSLKNMLAVCDILVPHMTSLDDCDIVRVVEKANKVLDCISGDLCVDELPKFNMDNISSKIFKTGMHDDLDKMNKELEDVLGIFDTIMTQLNELAMSSQLGDGIFKLEQNDREGHFLLVTSKRFQDFMRLHKDSIISCGTSSYQVSNLSSKAVSHSSSSVKVTFPCFKVVSEKAELLGNKVRKLVTDCFKTFLIKFSGCSTVHSGNLTRFLAYADFYWCCVENATNYRYCQPTIMDEHSTKSYIRATGLRHPIIERINDNVKYVSNDVSLGEPELDGMLLYGLNSAGKSSLMKSIGIAVVMAQAGMYVACESMQYYPYEYVFTRIFSCDDIFKGQSTFTKEMMELRGILKRANANSLVLGDELCSGTESISALSIVSAGVHTLASRRASFIFATHLHDLVTIPLVKELQNVKSFHLSMEYDEVNKRLVYDRHLKPGNGSSLYGLEVCKSLDLDGDFLELANIVRQGILGLTAGIVSTKSNQNKYNTKVFKDVCQVCNENKAEEIHHIAQQKDANENGYIDTFHKNDKFNLVCLCETCHNMVHHGSLEIKGYVQTTEGVQLSFTRQEQNKPNVSEFDEEKVRAHIQQLLANNPMIKRKDILVSIQTNYIGATPYKVDKVLKSLR